MKAHYKRHAKSLNVADEYGDESNDEEYDQAEDYN